MPHQRGVFLVLRDDDGCWGSRAQKPSGSRSSAPLVEALAGAIGLLGGRRAWSQPSIFEEPDARRMSPDSATRRRTRIGLFTETSLRGPQLERKACPDIPSDRVEPGRAGIGAGGCRDLPALRATLRGRDRRRAGNRQDDAVAGGGRACSCAGCASADRAADRVGSQARLRGARGSARRRAGRALRATARAAAGRSRRRAPTRRLHPASRASRRRRRIPHAPARARRRIGGRVRDRRPPLARCFFGGGSRVRAAPARRGAGAGPLLGACDGARASADPCARARPPGRAPRAGTAFGRRPPPRAHAGAREYVSATDARANRAGVGRQPPLRDRDRARAQPPRRARHLEPRSRPTGPRRARPGTRQGPSGRGARRAAARRGPGAARHGGDRSGRPRACGGGGARARRGGRADRVRPPALRVGGVLRRSGGSAPRGASRRRRPGARPGGASATSRTRGARAGRRGRAGAPGGRPPRAHARLSGLRRRVDRARTTAASGERSGATGAPARACRATPSRKRLPGRAGAARRVAHDASAG